MKQKRLPGILNIKCCAAITYRNCPVNSVELVCSFLFLNISNIVRGTESVPEKCEKKTKIKKKIKLLEKDQVRANWSWLIFFSFVHDATITNKISYILNRSVFQSRVLRDLATLTLQLCCQVSAWYVSFKVFHYCCNFIVAPLLFDASSWVEICQ